MTESPLNDHLSELTANAVLVVAHPDDEVLWFSGVLAQVQRIIICFGPYPPQPSLGLARQRVRERHPLTNITWLDLTEPASLLAADWRHAVPGPEGLRLSRWSAARRRYRGAYQQVEQALSRELAPYQNIITHNPWGEYGHEDHVLVHRAAVNVARGRNQRVWYSNYCSLRSISLAEQSTGGLRGTRGVVRPTDLTLMEKIKEIYLDEMCWTWEPTDGWFHEEIYYEAIHDSEMPAPIHRCLTLNLIVGVPFGAGQFQRVTSRLMSRALRPGTKRGLQTPDRCILEQRILPFLAADNTHSKVLFVGVDWYTQRYRDLFRSKNLTTIDVDSQKVGFGATEHIVDSLVNLGSHVADGTFEVIVCNGVIGFGLNDSSSIERAIDACWRALRSGGRLVLGWNNVARYRPIRPENIEALKRFAKWQFPPLNASRYAVERSLLRHTFDFYSKEESLPGHD
jgi:LmbE family N-acetylglucosaminyl deacetylase